MKKIIIFCITINIILYSTILYFVFIKNTNEEIVYMQNLVNETKEDAISKLKDFEVEVIESNSDRDKGTVLYTEPRENELVYKGQHIKLFISNGYHSESYRILINKHYEDNIDYLNNISEKYNINVIVENQISDNYPDGVIIYQSTNGNIRNNEEFKIIVNYNKPLILIPNLIGKSELDVLEYFKNYDIIICFIYEKKNGTNLVFNQSINEGSLVFNKSFLYVYISI